MTQRQRMPVGLSMAMLAGLLAASGCAGDGMLSGEGLISTAKTVTVSDQGFKPDSLTVQAGDTVTFQWFGQNTNQHEVVISGLSNGTMTSQNQRTGAFSVVFPSAGNYSVTDADNAGFAATVVVLR